MARPTEYTTDYCDKVTEFGRAGKSLTWMAATLGVSRECIYEWMRVHPEFSDAMTHARALSQAWWEDQGQENLLLAPGVGTFNGSVWSRSMSARFPEEWRENTKTEITGPNGGPVQNHLTVEFVKPQ